MKRLFRGGPWDMRAADVDPQPNIVVPTIDRDTGFMSQTIYEAHRFVTGIPHPCVPHVDVAEQWIVYVHGEPPTPDRVRRQLRALDIRPEGFRWIPQLQRGDAPHWAGGIGSR